MKWEEWERPTYKRILEMHSGNRNHVLERLANGEFSLDEQECFTSESFLEGRMLLLTKALNRLSAVLEVQDSGRR